MGELIVIGDRVLIDPQDGERQTDSGLVLPASVLEKEKVARGTVVRVGPGYTIPNPDYSEGEPWSPAQDSVRYLPLQARPGDEALYLRKGAVEIRYDDRAYLIIHHGDILALVRPSETDLLDDLKNILGGAE
ncbi:MAG: co-chaperone GroES [Rhodothermales bacterium]|nr:co-chaperone GroES [Rhodothermales bacterium]